MITNDNSESSDVKIARLKQMGKKNIEIANEVFPDLPIESAVVKVSRHLKKDRVAQYLLQSREQTIKELGLNWHELFSVFTEALEANKTVVHGKDEDSWVEVVPDHTIRMNAAKELIKHMPTQISSNPLDGIDFSSLDEVELNQAVFRKSPPTG